MIVQSTRGFFAVSACTSWHTRTYLVFQFCELLAQQTDIFGHSQVRKSLCAGVLNPEFQGRGKSLVWRVRGQGRCCVREHGGGGEEGGRDYRASSWLLEWGRATLNTLRTRSLSPLLVDEELHVHNPQPRGKLRVSFAVGYKAGERRTGTRRGHARFWKGGTAKQALVWCVGIT